MYNASIKIGLTFLMFTFASHAVPTNAKSAIDEASKAGRFLFMTFFEAKDASFTAIASSIEAFKKTGATNVALFNAKVSDPVNKEIVEKYGIKTTDCPILLVIAPNGVVTGGFPKKVTADQLKVSVNVPALMLEVLRPLQDQKVTLVALQNQSTKFNTESWQGVSDFANDPNYKQLVTAIKADPTDAGSQDFLKQCQLIAPLTEATVVVLLPPGKIGKVITGKTTKDDILKTLQACTAGSGCCPSDRRFKQSITPIDSALEKVCKLQGVTFTWDRDAHPRRFFPEGTQIGLIAQDVEPVIPEVVYTDTEGFKSITYDRLTAVLIEAVKALNKKVAIQDSLIQAQNSRIKELEGKRR